ncbi:hypothetical protein BMR1_01G02095 [Babesia microti strain RI]|uniref:Uncharacterized protein n=1 Tax=Babesia microti (strain RI) TaxID=1133968 RepID=I7J5H2_BABMR|nr:hypothetical protein BMR1_01G02095 [Babesia microti strain RI]CCF72877.1 hypothetical protein BMR1_01G02095 [Babesia microti strain RI]|eukprot:XP_012647486.1 hypothetical protein BMR1_01G02095 [Babesia microti strain RI]
MADISQIPHIIHDTTSYSFTTLSQFYWFKQTNAHIYIYQEIVNSTKYLICAVNNLNTHTNVFHDKILVELIINNIFMIFPAETHSVCIVAQNIVTKITFM